MSTSADTNQYALVVQFEYDIPSVIGPFDSVADAQRAAEDYREKAGLPREATPENNEHWTNLDWWFGIVPLEDAPDEVEKT